MEEIRSRPLRSRPHRQSSGVSGPIKALPNSKEQENQNQEIEKKNFHTTGRIKKRTVPITRGKRIWKGFAPTEKIQECVRDFHSGRRKSRYETE
ncbi:hypothetical protein Anas_08581 [Armadillidium nasatum]|uniref:Uncharacterized protein n=1 Tax=Armadillidium nasatum TaxID=96803 RepID=A0A5N5SYQ0_9CRUS|nr:hypothetical protein Anas_08581 [Armadillidium nasatum]